MCLSYSFLRKKRTNFIEISEFDHSSIRTQQFGHFLEQLLRVGDVILLICCLLYQIFRQTSHLVQRLVFCDYLYHKPKGALSESLTETMDDKTPRPHTPPYQTCTENAPPC